MLIKLQNINIFIIYFYLYILLLLSYFSNEVVNELKDLDEIKENVDIKIPQELLE